MARKLHFCALIWLMLWLALTTVRQVFDIIGKLWVLVLVDMAQLIAIVSGLVALCQPSLKPCRNRLLLTVLALISALSVGHNVALLLWFCTDLLVDDHRQNNLLSFGLPSFGHGFFLQHTPLCGEAEEAPLFNASGDGFEEQWAQQQEHCPIQYSHLEGGQAVLHTLMALGTLLLVVTILLWNNTNSNENDTHRLPYAAERTVAKKYGFDPEGYVSAAAGGRDTVSTNTKQLGSVYMDPSCCFDESLSVAGSVQLVASGKIAPAPPAIAPPVVAAGVVRRSYPRAGRRPNASAAPTAGGDCPQRSKRGNLKKLAAAAAVAHNNRSTPASPSPAIGPLSPAVAAHERYSSLSTAGATDAIQPYHHRAIANTSNNNTASSTSTASAYGKCVTTVYGSRGYSTQLSLIGGDNINNNSMASNGSGGGGDNSSYHNRRYVYGGRRASPSFYTPLAGSAPPRSPCMLGGVRERSVAMQQLTAHPQQHLQYNGRRGGSMRTFCATVAEPSDAGAELANDGHVAGDYAVQRRQRITFSPPVVAAFSPHCSPSSLFTTNNNNNNNNNNAQSTQHYALGLRRSTDGRRSAGPIAGDHSSNSRTTASLINFVDPNKNNSSHDHHHMTSLISFDPKSNTLIRVREHRRPSSTSSSSAGGGGDHSESVVVPPSSPAPDLPPSCPPSRFELLHQQQHQLSRTAANSMAISALTNHSNFPSSILDHDHQQPQQLLPPYSSLSNANNGYGSTCQHQNEGYNNAHNYHNNNFNNADCQHNGRSVTTATVQQKPSANASAAAPNASSNTSASMYEAYVGAAVPLDSSTAFPALIAGGHQSPATARRRSLLFDCSAASAIRLSQHNSGGGGEHCCASSAEPATSSDKSPQNQTTTTAAAFRPRVGTSSTTTAETMLGMFV